MPKSRIQTPRGPGSSSHSPQFSAPVPLVSSGPARILGLADRGALCPGLRADLVVLEASSRKVMASMAAGRISYLSGEAAARFIG